MISPAELHAETKLAVFLTAKCVGRFDTGGLKLAAMSTFQIIRVVFKIVGGVTAAIGIAIDAVSLIDAGIELYNNNKCGVSQDISKHIEKLEHLGYMLEELNQKLTANIKSVEA